MNFLNDDKRDNSNVYIEDGIITCGNAIFIKEEIDSFDIESENGCSGGYSNVKVKSEKNEDFEENLESEDIDLVKGESTDKSEENIDFIKKGNKYFDEMDFTKEKTGLLDVELDNEAAAGSSMVNVESVDTNVIDVVKKKFSPLSQSFSNGDLEIHRDANSVDVEPTSTSKEASCLVQEKNGTIPTNRTIEDTLNCGDCSLRFEDKTALMRHSRIHKRKTFTCDICCKGFNGKQKLIVHMRIHTGEKPFQCDVCWKMFTRKDILKDHMRIHSGEKPFHCDICQKDFADRRNLTNHLRVHTGEKPFLCHLCHKSFADRSNLVRHLQIHSEEKSFQCDICHKSFSRKYTLKYHLRIHAGERPFVCDICPASFTQKSTLINHLRIHK